MGATLRAGANAVTAFAAVPAAEARFGNAGRNILIDPALKNWDVSVAENLTFGEHLRCQFRAEFFNFFNNVNFSQPQYMFNVTSPLSGAINKARRAR